MVNKLYSKSKDQINVSSRIIIIYFDYEYELTK